jgi:hypothetical protein
VTKETHVDTINTEMLARQNVLDQAIIAIIARAVPVVSQARVAADHPPTYCKVG